MFSHFSVTCQLEQYFEQADKFLPERWLRNQSTIKATNNTFALLPFGFGARMCAGRRFSELELYIATAKMILNYELHTISEQKLERTHAFIIVPEMPIKVRCTTRN